MTKKIETLINTYLSRAKTGLNTYRENIQTAYEIFISHYNTDLNYNSTPLLAIVKALNTNDRKTFLEYIKLSTNIEKAVFTEKGCSLKFTNVTDEKAPLIIDNDFIDSNKWYTKQEKAEKAPINLTTEQLEKRLATIINLINTSDNISKEKAKEIINNAVLKIA